MKKKISPTKRRAVGGSQRDWVSVEPLLQGRAIPVVVRPKAEGLELVPWAQANQDWIEELLWKHRALLFRGFESGGIDGFQAFVETTSRGERLEYKDRSTPRDSYGDKIYNATIYPSEQRINLHNEGTYWIAWAKKIYFGCVVNAETGGETPIGDIHNVYQRIAPDVRREFEQRQILYVRNYNSGLGLPWQEVFQTEDPAEVEAYCRDNRIEWEWKGKDRLRTRQKRPAVRRHAVTGEPVWFNHGAFFHVGALEPKLRDTFLAELGEEELPYNTYYGDGGRIDFQTIAHVLSCYEEEKVVFRWQQGDVALYDNMRIAHAREPYTGERLTLVAMTEPWRGDEG